LLITAEPAGDWRETWKYMDFKEVQWRALPEQTLTMISMTLVVALSSCLDVAAIELELGKKLDYDHELSTVGLSNFVSGVTGGYSGSYIFSQTIFTLRSGVRDRIAGFTVAILEGVVVCMPFPIIAYIPKLFFGSLLVMICADLMNEWLLEVRKKMTGLEVREEQRTEGWAEGWAEGWSEATARAESNMLSFRFALNPFAHRFAPCSLRSSQYASAIGTFALTMVLGEIW